MRTLFSREIVSLLFSCTTVRWNNQLNSVSGGTSSVTVQRTAQGRVTSDCPTIELCDRARSFTGGRCKYEMSAISVTSS